MKLISLYSLACCLFALRAVGQETVPVEAQQTAPKYVESGIYAENAPQAVPPGEVPPPGVSPTTPPAYVPLSVGQKFVFRTKSTFGPAVLVFDALSAGYDQLTNTPGPWGQGGQAYAQRYASEFGITMIDQYSQFFLESALHEDPRYFLSTDRSFKARVRSAVKQTLVKKTDSGGQQFAFAEFGGALAAGFASNAWLPNSNNTAGDALETAALVVGRTLAVNLALEFIPLFRRIH